METPYDIRHAYRSTADRLADKVSAHRSEVCYGADVLNQQKKNARRAFSRADRRFARAFCAAFITVEE